MLGRTLWPPRFLPVLLLLTDPGHVRDERRFQDKELAQLAASLTRHREARTTGLGVEQAKAELSASLARLQEQSEGRDPLRYPADVGRATWLSWDHDQ